VGLELGLGGRLAEAAGRGAGSGVLVGTLLGEAYTVLFLAETPADAEEEAAGEEQAAAARAELDVAWLAEHARQVARLLPGGLSVLGYFLARPDTFLAAHDSKLRALLREAAALEAAGPGDLLLLQSAMAAKVLDSSTSSFRPVEVRPRPRPTPLVRLETALVLDVPVAMAADTADLARDAALAMDKFKVLLDSAVFVFDNKMLRDDTVLGKPVEVEKKKGKGKAAKAVEEAEDEEEEEVQEVVKVELLMRERRLEEVVTEEGSKARMKLAGKVACRCYLPPGATVAWARAAVTADLARSLATRLAMHAEGGAGGGEEAKVVHEPPRRVFVSVPDTTVTVSDYLYPGEGAEDCLANIGEIFGWTLGEEAVEDDLEIVASPREARPVTQVARTLTLTLTLTPGSRKPRAWLAGSLPARRQFFTMRRRKISFWPIKTAGSLVIILQAGRLLACRQSGF